MLVHLGYSKGSLRGQPYFGKGTLVTSRFYNFLDFWYVLIFFKNLSKSTFSDVLVVKNGFLAKFYPYTLNKRSGGLDLGQIWCVNRSFL